MKMKTMQAFVMAFLIFSVSQVYAQDKSNEERARALTEKMKEDLALSNDQYEKAYTINLAFVGKASQVRNSGGGKLAKFRKLKDADNERDKLLKGVLSEEQYKKFKEQKAENRQEMKKKMDQRKNG